MITDKVDLSTNQRCDCGLSQIIRLNVITFQTFSSKKTFRIFKCKIRNIFSNPTKEVTDIRAIQLNRSFTQVTFFRFIADGFKSIFIHNKTSRISSVNNYIYLFGGALAS